MEAGGEKCKVEIGGKSVRLSNDLVAITYDTLLGECSLTSADGNQIFFSRAYLQIRTERFVYDSRRMVYKSVSVAEFRNLRGEGKAVVLRLQDTERSADISIRLAIVKGVPGYSCIVRFRNNADAVRVVSMNPFVLDVDENSRLFTGQNGDDLMFFRNGFQSWDLSQALPIEQGKNESHLFSVLSNIRSGDSLVLGFITMADQIATITVNGREARESRLAGLVSSALIEVDIPRKGQVASEELLVMASRNAAKNLSTYADMVSEKMKAISWHNTPTGWCSWYYYYTLPDENDIMTNAEQVRQRYGKSIEWIQIDDGYQKSVGDWKENSRFLSGLKQLVMKITKLGLKAGLWVAPFVASEHSDLFKDKPNWFVRDDDNVPIVVDQNPLWLGNYYALDLTNPSVLEFLESTFKRLRSCGFEYFKIDFLYHAAVKGRRHDPKRTRAQAVRKGLEVVRDAVGDSFLLGCGAPLGPSVGIVNGMRIGTDIAAAWRLDWGGGVYECSINTMTRSILHNRWWKNDPDCILIRQDGTNLTPNELELWLTVVALSGGLLLLSDKMDEVSEKNKALVDKMLPIYKHGAVALDAYVEPEPRLLALAVDNAIGKWVVLGAFNLSEKDIDVRTNMKDLGLNEDQPHHIFDFWKQEYEGVAEGEVVLRGLKPHACRLLSIRPKTEAPDILSTTMHFTQGGIELKRKKWHPETGELEVIIDRTTRSEEAIYLVFNQEWTPTNAFLGKEPVTLDRITPEVVAIRSQFERGQALTVRFSCD
ncbi:MAG: alpha-galactosidase [Candidatus Thorarchaeota archaeon]|nr:alpha-galactosidase [Candidatus Thorarchaeota archaeon]